MLKKMMLIVTAMVAVLAVVSIVLYLSLPELNEAYLEETAQKAMDKFSVPAICLGIQHPDGAGIKYSTGYRVAGGEAEMSPEDYFHIGSCSKSLLSMIAATAVEQGKIQWDTRFFDIYPELKDAADSSYRDITLQDLLACRAGIKPYTSGYEEYPDLSASTDVKTDFIKYLLSLPPAAEKTVEGFPHLYSNASYSLASAMLEKCTAMDYRELIDSFVVGELGIEVAYGWPYLAGTDQPLGHLKGEDGVLIPFGPDIEYYLNPLIAPAGDLSLTQDGFMKLAGLHLTGLKTGNRLSRQSWEHMDQLYDGFSLGAYHDKIIGRNYVLLDGTAGTFFARAIILPERDIAYTILMNSGEEAAVNYITMRLAKAEYRWWWMFWV